MHLCQIFTKNSSFLKKRCLRTLKSNIFNSGRIFIPSLSKSGNFEVYFLRFLFIMTRFFPFLSENYAVLRVLYQLRFLFLIFTQLSPQITVFSPLQQQQQQQQQQQCIYLKKYKVYNTLCPAMSYNAANLGRTRLLIKTLLNYIRKKKEKKYKNIQKETPYI